MMTRTFPFASREARQRRDVAADLLGRLPADSRIRPITPAAGVAGYLRLPVLLSRGMAGFGDPGRAERLGFAAGYPAILAALEPVRQRLFGPANRWPGAVDLTRRLVTLPTHSRLTVQDRDALLEALDRYRG
jgi:dTDP-4-amino-4,6-dideoxygalactose transaminase